MPFGDVRFTGWGVLSLCVVATIAISDVTVVLEIRVFQFWSVGAVDSCVSCCVYLDVVLSFCSSGW